MIVSHRHRFIFIKTHKTAGSSFECGFGPRLGPDDIVPPMNLKTPESYARNYYDYRGIGKLYGKSPVLRKFLNRRSFWVGRWYWEHMPAQRIRRLVGEDVWSGYFKFCFERNPWDKVVSYYLWKVHGQKKKLPPFREYVLEKSHRLPCDGDLYLDADGGMLVDRVFQFARIDETVTDLCEQFGMPGGWSLPREKAGNRPERKPYWDYYDDDTRARVAELFSREIKLLGYEFGQ